MTRVTVAGSAIAVTESKRLYVSPAAGTATAKLSDNARFLRCSAPRLRRYSRSPAPRFSKLSTLPGYRRIVGKRGPKPQPTHLRLLTGSHPERVNRYEPMPRAALPVCPDGVSSEVREVWDYTLAELSAMGSVSAADRDALVCYCEAVVTHRKASELVAGTAILVRSARSAAHSGA